MVGHDAGMQAVATGEAHVERHFGTDESLALAGLLLAHVHIALGHFALVIHEFTVKG